MSINQVTLTGNLTRDPELRATQSGMQVLNFGIAVNDRVKNNQTDQWEDRANFIDCVMFGNRAEAVMQYLSKGTKVAIEGKLRWSQWESNGNKRSKIEVVVDELEFLSRNQQPTHQHNPQYQTPPVQQAPVQQAPVQQAPILTQPAMYQEPVYAPNYADENIPF